MVGFNSVLKASGIPWFGALDLWPLASQGCLRRIKMIKPGLRLGFRVLHVIPRIDLSLSLYVYIHMYKYSNEI